MAKAKKQTPEEKMIETGTRLSALWMEFRKHFRRAFGKQEIPAPEEQRFLQLKSEITRVQRVLAQNVPAGLDYGLKTINNLMTQAISIETLRDMPMNDKKSLYEEWHQAYIRIQNMLGVLDVMAEGHQVHFAQKRSQSANIKESIGAVEDEKGSGKMKKIVIGLVIAGAVGYAVWYLLIRQG